MLRLNTLGGLWIEGRAAAEGELRPRRLALLAILAAAGPKGISRDRVLAILWSESALDRARRSLSQILYGLRNDLGVDVVIVSPNLHLDASLITSDIGELRDAMADLSSGAAEELFAGPFLDGFYLTDAPQFERWVEEERSALSHDVLRAIEALARSAAVAGFGEKAAEYWRRLTRLDPMNGAFASGYIEALSVAGERAAALQHAESHTERVRREMQVEPDAAILRFIASAREAAAAASRVRVPDALPVTPSAAPRSTPIAATLRPSRPAAVKREPARRSLMPWIGLGAIVLAGLAGVLWRTTRASGPRATAASRATGGTSSPLAQRLYDEGLRAFYQSDAVAASRLFQAAITEDSSFVMAAYFAWRSEVATNGTDGLAQDALADRAVSLAASAPERDRLLIVARVSASRWELRAVPAAETLATRYPNDVDALIGAADIEANLPHARTLFDRAIALDSAAMRSAGLTVACRSCDALRALADRYEAADSIERVEETLNRWSTLRPDDYQPWNARADFLVALGRGREAEAALRRADSLGAPRGDSAERVLVRSLRLDDFASSNAICRDKLAVADLDEFARFRWLCTIGLRMQGRHRDALGLIHSGRVPGTTVVRAGIPLDRINAAILETEMGRPTAAAFSYSSLATETARSTLSEGRLARRLAWELTLAATAYALAGETVRVRVLADSVELVGRRSLDLRDSRLHHFLRGLVLADAREHEQAVREFRAAVSSPTRGFTRINYEMGKSLIALRRPAEAVAVTRSALRSRLDESSLHVTRTELHELAAQAFAAAGQRDSAAFHNAIVERAWRSADPAFATRYEAARQGLLRAGLSAR
jgi:DNA-binding SARP family transcriptional activator